MVINGLIVIQTCGACPEQYDVFLGDKQIGYVRLRGGALRSLRSLHREVRPGRCLPQGRWQPNQLPRAG